MSLLSIRDVSIRFGGVQALDRVSFELNRGEVLGLIGPNGAGKTTMFNCISGVLTPDSGRIMFEDESVLLLKPHQRAQRGIARTFQNLQLWSTMTVRENCELPIDAIGRRNILSDSLTLPWSRRAELSAREHARGVLHALGLLQYEEERAGDLPVGIQRQVEIARALCLRPKLLLLDEPAAGLDADETLRLADSLARIRERFKVSMLLVDHDMSLVMRACHYIYVLDFGRMLAEGKPQQIRDNPQVIAAYLGEGGDKPAAPEEDAGLTVTATRTRGRRKAAAGAPPAPEEREPLLHVRGVAAGYEGIEVIRDVNLTVGFGEVVAVIGANGAGKTTTLRAISGVIRPTRGSIEFDGQEISRKPAEQIVRLGLLHVPQGRGLFPKLSVEETLKLSSYSGNQEDNLERAFEVFPRLKQRRLQLVGTLSGGEQQMVAMARALLVKPRLLMIDEMSQGLAPTVVQMLFRSIDTFRQQGIAVLLVEQFVDSALSVADRAYIFEQGSVAHEASAARLRRDESLIASAYLGHAAASGEEAVAVAANGNGSVRSSEMLEEMMLKLPAELKRSLEERAAGEGRKPEELVLELLGGQEK
jgi:branched-chain amino acid transport system ATP-binding protein